MARALSVFTVSAAYGAFRVRVRLLPTVKDVDAEFRASWRASRSEWVRAFFAPHQSPRALHVGTIVLPANDSIAELVPHEVAHAVIEHYGMANLADDEPVAASIGYLTERIFSHLKCLGMEV